jgi:hypothetical protein
MAWVSLATLHAVLRVGVGGWLAGGELAAHCLVLCSWIVPITSAVIPGQPGSHPSLGKSAGWLSCLAGSVRAVASAWAVVATALAALLTSPGSVGVVGYQDRRRSTASDRALRISRMSNRHLSYSA